MYCHGTERREGEKKNLIQFPPPRPHGTGVVSCFVAGLAGPAGPADWLVGSRYKSIPNQRHRGGNRTGARLAMDFLRRLPYLPSRSRIRRTRAWIEMSNPSPSPGVGEVKSHSPIESSQRLPYRPSSSDGRPYWPPKNPSSPSIQISGMS